MPAGSSETVLDLLVHCHEPDAFTAGPRYAAQLAGALGAALTGLYNAAPAPQLPLDDAPPSLASEFADFVREETERAERGGAAFARRAASFGVHRTHWQVAVGPLRDILVAASNWNDLLVLEHRERVPQICDVIAHAALAGVPCLVVRESTAPATPSLNCAAIAWNASPEAVRAVKAAIPLLKLAQRTVVLTASAPVRERRMMCEPEFSLPSYLQRHGIAAQSIALDTAQRPVEEAILMGCAQIGADLLVMGAFGSSRLRAHDIRGVTHYILERGSLPLLLRH